ncbi:wax ester/triacylglycerol synthase family O-acyltransferase [Sorangium sp. So ce429]
MTSYDVLSAHDASFLYNETQAAHMHVGALAILERVQLSEEQVRAHVNSRLHLVPRLRRRVAWVPGNIGRPALLDDPSFDIRSHVRFCELPAPRGVEQARQLMAELMSVRLDRGRPLWEIWFFDLSEERTGFIFKIHHCLVDGVSGVNVATVLLDPEKEPVRIEPPPFRPEAQPSRAKRLVDAVVEAYTPPIELIRWLRGSEAEESRGVRRAADIAKGTLSWARSVRELAPRTSLSTPIGAARRFASVRARLDDFKEIKKRYACTVNDVVLAAVAGGLGELMRARGEDTDGLTMKAMVPVSLRDPSQRMGHGNKVSMMAAELPVGLRGAGERVEFVRDRVAELKKSKQSLGSELFMKLSEYAPPAVLALTGQALTQRSHVNLVITNVPGPQFPLYFQGAKLLDAIPCLPLFGTNSVGVAVLSYDGYIHFGLLGDRDALPDLHLFSQGIEEAIREMLSAVGRGDPPRAGAAE